MTEITTSVPSEPSPPQSDEALAQRLSALKAGRASASARPNATAAAPKNKSSGPAPGRILAAAASMSAGIGLVALMAGAQQDVVVQVNPTPVTVQPANIIVEIPSATSGELGTPDVQVRVVEPATPVERAAPQARVVTQSEGS